MHKIVRIPDGQGTFMIISDLQGYGYSNIDVRGIIAAISILQVEIIIFLLHQFKIKFEHIL